MRSILIYIEQKVLKKFQSKPLIHLIQQKYIKKQQMNRSKTCNKSVKQVSTAHHKSNFGSTNQRAIQNKTLYFRPIKQHCCYAKIRQRLNIIRHKIEFRNLAQILSEFKFLTRNQSFIKNYTNCFNRIDKILSKNYQKFNDLNIYEKQLQEKFFYGKSKDRFYQLQKLVEQKIIQVFNCMAYFILDCENKHQIQKIQICYSGNYDFHYYTKTQIVYIISLMALNLIPTQNYHTYSNDSFNKSNNFMDIYANQMLKTQALIRYFYLYAFSQPQNKKFTIKRNHAQWSQVRQKINSNIIMGQYNILPDSYKIQEYLYKSKKKNQSPQQFKNRQIKKVQVDFANQKIGGGVLFKGLVQQEILYMNHPQLLATTVLCQSLGGSQSLFYKGFTKYFSNVGYGKGLLGFELEQQKNRRQTTYIIAIDATNFNKKTQQSGFNPIYNINQFKQQNEFDQKSINRQITKAYSGFINSPNNAQIVTGNWGCGVFGGNHFLKFMIQWIAASAAGKTMVYCPYGQSQKIFTNRKKQIFLDIVKNLPVTTVYDCLIKTCKKNPNPNLVMSCLQSQILSITQKYHYDQVETVARQSFGKDYRIGLTNNQDNGHFNSKNINYDYFKPEQREIIWNNNTNNQNNMNERGPNNFNQQIFSENQTKKKYNDYGSSNRNNSNRNR